MYSKNIFTSESVSEGHPDKICDQISDAILDAYIAQDIFAKVACETLATTNQIVIAGEVNSTATVNIESIVRKTIKEIGYCSKEIGIDADNCDILNLLHNQSPDIAQGVDSRNDGIIGAGDQGMMFGYAESGNESYMPLPIVIAHNLVRVATEKRKSGEFKFARPDMKTQVTIDYSGNKPLIDTVVFSVQHDEDYNHDEFVKYLQNEIINPILKQFEVHTANYKIYINPTGRFVIGGPHGDTGLTGRKIIVDTYGGYARHGGGAFSGKDATKVDRSGAYMARFLAKNIVASGVAEKCEIQLAYAIGVAEPVSILVDTFGTNKVPTEKIIQTVFEHVDLTPQGIIDTLNLRRPIYQKTAAYGHFGRTDIQLPWEELTIKSLFSALL